MIFFQASLEGVEITTWDVEKEFYVLHGLIVELCYGTLGFCKNGALIARPPDSSLFFQERQSTGCP